MYNFQKKACLERAGNLIESETPASLRYACLELRQCIESIAYDKMKMYKKFVPESEFNRWQPKQVFDFLEEIEPESTKDYHLTISEQNHDQTQNRIIFSDDHKTLKPKHIKKIYNKLGSHLHTPTIAQQADYKEKQAKLRSDLQSYLSELRPIVDSKFDSNIGTVCSFECESCNSIIYHREHNLEIGKQVQCPKSSCGMLYVCREIEVEKVTFEPVQVEIKCQCGETIFINYFKLKDPSNIQCKCSRIYDFKKQWVYSERT